MPEYYSYPLSHFDARPSSVAVDTIVVHCMYRNDALFPYDSEACLKSLDLNAVSSHYTIDRLGCTYCSVPENARAWHAGKSFLPEKGVERVNDFSIGIELIGNPEMPFPHVQYLKLIELVEEIKLRHQIKYLVGHDYIAPERKIDPGPLFNWQALGKHFPALTIPQNRQHPESL